MEIQETKFTSWLPLQDRTRVQEKESELLRECWKTPEHKEAVNAFIEKREPKFR